VADEERQDNVRHALHCMEVEPMLTQAA